MRVRLPELMAEHGMTAYQVARAAAERGVSERAIYRMAAAKGAFTRLDMRVLAVLCDIFDVEPGDLLERDKKKR